MIRIRQMEYGFLVCDRRLAHKHTSLISGIWMAVNINNIFVCHNGACDVRLGERRSSIRSEPADCTSSSMNIHEALEAQRLNGLFPSSGWVFFITFSFF